tara:strand:+ start:312 stop:443 length:132 start_codon:yes stop_codon:yes gene_type:complete
MTQVRNMLHAVSKWWYDNVSNRYEPSKHYFRGRLSDWHKEEQK